MARYMLDTNMILSLIKDQPPKATDRFAECLVGDVVMSAVSYAELEAGVATAINPRRERRHLASLIEQIPVAAFDHRAAQSFAELRDAARTKKADFADILIAAHAVSLDVALVTSKLRDFFIYPGLRTENWLE